MIASTVRWALNGANREIYVLAYIPARIGNYIFLVEVNEIVEKSTTPKQRTKTDYPGKLMFN